MDYRDEVYFDSIPEAEPPFGDEEFAARLARLRRRMADAKVDMLYLMSPESMYYLTGYQAVWYQGQSPRQWPAASSVAVHVDHDHVIRFDSEREAVLGRIFTRSRDTRFFPRTALRGSPGFVADELGQLGWLNGTVGLELLSYRPNRVVGAEIEQAFTDRGARRIVDGTDLVRDLRWIKSPAEMDCLREASRIADIGMGAAQAVLRDGVSELEVYGEMVRAMAAAGGENPGNMMPVLSGTKTNALHGVPTRRVMRRGELVLVDLCGVFKRYHVNLARTFFLGEPSVEVRRITGLVAGSIDMIAGLIKPNLSVTALNRAVLAYFKDAGLWGSRGWIGGYEMGIAFPPDWTGHFVFDPLADPDDGRRFEANTAVNYENQFFMPDHRGQYFSVDSLLFEQASARVMSALPSDLVAID